MVEAAGAQRLALDHQVLPHHQEGERVLAHLLARGGDRFEDALDVAGQRGLCALEALERLVELAAGFFVVVSQTFAHGF